MKDARHLQLFMQEYQQAKQAVIVCRTPFRREIAKNIVAIPWMEWQSFLEGIYSPR